MFKTLDSFTLPWKKLTKDYEKASSAFLQSLQNSPSQLNLVGQSLKTLSTVKARIDQNLEKFWESFRMVSAADIERVYERLGDIQDRLDELSETLESQSQSQNGKIDNDE